MRPLAELGACAVLLYVAVRLALSAYHGPRDGIPAGIFRPDDAALILGAMLAGAMLVQTAWRYWRRSRAKRR